jgi:RNA polymerase sporulation-specific sigma factor
MNKGMSFLNFAKMCIRRHLITLLNTSKTRLKDQSMNRAISLDSSPLGDDDDGKNSFLNIIADEGLSGDKVAENNEAYRITKTALFNALSSFEQVVLEEYLSSSSYREISKNVTKKLGTRYNTKSIDNALLRIRKKAMYLIEHSKMEDVPLFLQ